ncbi:hypothetical protein Q8F55_007315 [Vanrija albida]|uniref:Uncharacterized protein n=1 Tax=Vanrija albida TaxID=181172 RepID=A0ABR3PZL1_9TREE
MKLTTLALFALAAAVHAAPVVDEDHEIRAMMSDVAKRGISPVCNDDEFPCCDGKYCARPHQVVCPGPVLCEYLFPKPCPPGIKACRCTGLCPPKNNPLLCPPLSECQGIRPPPNT